MTDLSLLNWGEHQNTHVCSIYFSLQTTCKISVPLTYHLEDDSDYDSSEDARVTVVDVNDSSLQAGREAAAKRNLAIDFMNLDFGDEGRGL